jgi:hypothetical protein
MANMSNYLESGIANHILRGAFFNKPSGIAIALTSSVPLDSDTGSTIAEIPSGINGSGTGYARINLGNPVDNGDGYWSHLAADIAVGSGVVKNASAHIYDTALLDLGWISGVAICDTADYGGGNVLIYGQLTNPRVIYTGDSLKFDIDSFEINFK